ncbi:MAG: phenylalanine--tRNA ligase subunit beta [Phycisphaeraceae bacterium]|nr:phenylalanine--tRNA ligase subunit beta [Phycisphaeraceae bacterium]
MKISLAWLNRCLDRSVTAEEAEQTLGRQGFPVEGRHALPNGDVMLDVEVTSNRGDCLYHVGVAREVAAGSGRTLKLPDIALTENAATPASSLTSIDNQALDLCPVYTARVIQGVKVGPSPRWLVDCLEAIGLRSVNNVVDVTNFVMMEMGQPLHAFDLARLKGRRIVVRRAIKGETIDAIDGTKHTLDDAMLAIADAERPVAVAGVMGGLNTEVSSGTTDILLESAQFAALPVRTTSRKLKLASDASYRFERGVDRAGVEQASRRAARLIVEVAGGKLASGVIRAGEPELPLATVTMRLARCEQLLGYAVPTDAIMRHLDHLGFAPQLDAVRQAIVCTVPSWRARDVEREVDLIEEIARMHGLDHVPTHDKMPVNIRPAQTRVAARQILAQTLVAHGYHETVTASFLRVPQGQAFLPQNAEGLEVSDDRRKAEPMLRPSLLPSLLVCRKSNQDVGNTGVKLFETAATWVRQAGQIVETRKLALLADADKPGDALRDLRGAMEELVERLGASAELTFAAEPLTPYETGIAIALNGLPLGVGGILGKATLKQFDLQTSVILAEVNLDPLLDLYPPHRKVTPLIRVPGIERDLSVIVAQSVTWDAIRQQAQAVAPAIMESLEFVTTYRGKPIPSGRKSVTMRMLFRDPAGTLRREQVDPHMQAIVDKLRDTVGAQVREA